MAGLGPMSRRERGTHAPRDTSPKAAESFTRLGQAAGTGERLMGLGPAALVNRAVQKATASPERLAAMEARAKKARSK